jgi:ATP-binding protein involved in chromosome partitioning
MVRHLTQDQIEKILTSVVDIYTEQDIVSSNALDSLEINGDKVPVNILLKFRASTGIYSNRYLGAFSKDDGQ